MIFSPRGKRNILNAMNLLLILAVGYIIGDMIDISFGYAVTRGAAIKDALVLLIICIIRLILDRIIITERVEASVQLEDDNPYTVSRNDSTDSAAEYEEAQIEGWTNVLGETQNEKDAGIKESFTTCKNVYSKAEAISVGVPEIVDRLNGKQETDKDSSDKGLDEKPDKKTNKKSDKKKDEDSEKELEKKSNEESYGELENKSKEESDEELDDMNPEETETGFSRLIIDAAVFVVVTILSIIMLDLYGKGNLSINLVTIILSVLILIMNEWRLYLKDSVRLVLPKSEIDIPDEAVEVAAVAEKRASQTDASEESEADSISKEDSEADSLSKEVTDTNKVKTSEKASHTTLPKGMLLTYIFRLIYILCITGYGILVMEGICVMRGGYGSMLGHIWKVLIALAAAVLLVMQMLYSTFRETYKENIQDYVYAKSKDRLTMSIITYAPEIVAGIIIGTGLCFTSVLIGLIYILSVIVATLIIPLLMDYIGTGGRWKVSAKCIYIGICAERIFAVIMLLIAVWLMSYGAIVGVGLILIMSAQLSYISFLE